MEYIFLSGRLAQECHCKIKWRDNLDQIETWNQEDEEYLLKSFLYLTHSPRLIFLNQISSRVSWEHIENPIKQRSMWWRSYTRTCMPSMRLINHKARNNIINSFNSYTNRYPGIWTHTTRTLMLVYTLKTVHKLYLFHCHKSCRQTLT